MDISTLIGIIGGIGLIIFGILWGQPSAAVLLNFVDIPSLFITVGGTFSSTLTSYKLKDFLNGLKSISIIFGKICLITYLEKLVGVFAISVDFKNTENISDRSF